jgi:5-methylcytosine-specific restriction endonuclease McrA
MTWFRVDDQFAHHPKARAAGVEGRALWLAAGTACAGQNTDGVVAPLVVKDSAYLAEVDAVIAAAGLVTSGLWHDVKTIRRCERCRAIAGRLEPGAFYFHDWLDYQLTRDVAKLPEHRLKHNRKKALSRDHALREAIVDRDRGHCRYCHKRVEFADRVSDDGGTYDHIDPDGPNSFDNCVVACRGCNIKKANRTPAEAGMTLLDPIEPYQIGGDQ